MRKTAIALIFCFVVFCPANTRAANDLDAAQDVIYAWRDAWQNQDVPRFISFYSPDFGSETLGLQGLIRQKTRLFQRPGPILVEISDLKIDIQGLRAVAVFVQRYQSPEYSDVGKKTLILIKSNAMWKIMAEEWQPLYVPDRTAEVLPAPPPPEKPVAKGIDFKIEEDGSEKVFVSLDTFAVPRVMTLEGDKPRIAIDMENIPSWDRSPLINTNGKLVKQIRTHLYRGDKKLRIVLDLDPAKNYIAELTYQKSKNRYCMRVRSLPDVVENSPAPETPEPTGRIISEEWQPMTEEEKAVEMPGSPPEQDALTIKSINFKIEKEGAEKVFIEMNRYAVPEIMALEGLNPRIAVDIKNIAAWDGKSTVPVNGKLIKQIRTHLYREDKKLRIVLDLDPEADYSVNPTYYRLNNIYCVEVKPSSGISQ